MRPTKALISRLYILAILVLGVSLPAQAQTSSGFSDYFILGHEEHVWNMMQRVRAGEGAAAFPAPSRMNSVASATSTSDGQILIFDHWEDGFEGTASVSTLTRSGTLATVTTAANHNYVNGAVVTIDGATSDPTLWNGTFSVTVTSATQFTYVMTGTPAVSPATGIIGASASPFDVAAHQATTLVLGDANIANGRACDWTSDPRVTCGGANPDKLFIGTAMTFASDQGMAGACAVPVASPAVTQLTCSVPVPRAVPSLANPTIRFDGGDRAFTTGGSLSIAHIQDPGTPLIGGGTELLARELVKNAVSYSIPIGENLFVGANNAYASAKYTSLDIVAFDDNTSIVVASPGAGTRSLVLHRGQHYATCTTFGAAVAGATTGNSSPCTAGAIDGPAPPAGFAENRGTFAALALRTNSGTKISTDKPLNALIFTGGGDDFGAGTAAYQTRHYATLPDILHATDYVTTAPGDNTATNGTRPLNLFIYNPNPTSAITVTRTDTSGTSSFSIPANSVVDYRNVVGAFVPNNSSVRLTSNRPFWGLSSYDSAGGLASDWGHAWLGVRFLQKDYTLAYSPGTQFAPVTTVAKTAGGVVTLTTGIAHNITANSLIRVTDIPIAGFNGQFIATAVTANTVTYTSVAGLVASTATTGSLSGICDNLDATRPCNSAGAVPNSYNRDPVWVAGTQDNTQVRVDLDADSLWDFIDTDSDGCPNTGDAAGTSCSTPTLPAGCPAVTAGQCVYIVNGPGSASRNVLRVWDPYDFDNAGSRVVSSNKVALSWGQDVDRAFNAGADPSPDTGYTVYPGEIAIDLVLGIEKTVSPLRVPLAGGVATYTVRVYAGDYGPLTFLTVKDTLPVGINCAAYVSGTTLITYPDLSTSNANPTCAVLPSGRSQLTWNPSPATLLVNQQTVITYNITIPPNATPRSLENEAEVIGSLGSSVFNPKDTALLNQSDLGIVKGVSDDGTPEVGDILTYTVSVQNGTAPDSNVSITDTVPAFTTFVQGTATTLGAGAIVRVGTLATVTQAGHGYATGDTIAISGAVQTAYNGGKVITVTGANTYTFKVYGAPVTPATGTITARSTSINAAASVTSITRAGAVATVTTPVAHNYSTGAIVTVAGATSDPTLYNGRFAITVTGATTFTYTMVGTPGTSPATGPITIRPSSSPLSPAQVVTIANPGANVARVTLNLHGFAVGDVIVVAGATQAAFNGTFAITAVAANTFDYTIVGSPGAATGSPTVTASEFFPGTYASGSNSITWAPALRTIASGGIARAGTVATATSPSHGFTRGQLVTIAGCADSNYNGVYPVATVTVPDTFTYTVANSGAATCVGTAVTATPALPANALVTETFQVQIANGTPTGSVIPNTANYSSASTPSADSNTVNTVVVGPALSIIKSGPAGPLHPDQLVDFELAVENTGTGFASNLVIADTLSTGNLTYVPGSLTTSLNAGAFTALSDPADADAGSAINSGLTRVVNTLTRVGNLGTATTSVAHGWLSGQNVTISGVTSDPTLWNETFSITVTGATTFTFLMNGAPGTSPATVAPFSAIANSTTITYAPIRAVTTLTSAGTLATVTTTTAHGWLTGQTVAINGATNDPAFYNGSFAITVTGANTFTYTMSGDPANNAPAGTITADVPLAPGSTRRLRFQARVNIGTGGLFGSNQATVTANGQPITGSNLYQEPIVGNATVTGHVFLDPNNNGVQDVGEPDLPNVSVTVTDVNNVVQVVVTDSSGNYSATVPPGLTNLNVDNADPDIPPGSTPSPLPSTDPQNVTAVINTVTGSINVGFRPPPVSISKASSGAGTAVPGQTLTYTVTVSNFSGVTQTNPVITEAVPADTTYVNLSAKLASPGIRVTEYYIDNAGADQCTETGTDFATGNLTCTMTLNQNLSNDYFVLVQGSDNNAGADSTPASDYVGLTGAPAGTPGVGAVGGLAASGAANRIVLTRGAGANAWLGVVTVVECLSACDTNGFRLRDVDRIVNTASAGAGDSDGTAWGTLARVVLFGGANGAGCVTADVAVLDHESCHVRLQPSGTNTINWQRQNADADVTTSTVMSVEFGSAWTVQRVRVGPAAPTVPVAANNGGDGVNATAEYNTTLLPTPVVRAQTWVWGTGFTNDPDVGESAEAAVITLGDGVTQLATESVVAVGTEEPETNTVVDFDVYVMTHPFLATDWDFKADGDPSCGIGGGGAQTCNVTTNSATANRLALVYNGTNDGGTTYPRSLLAARYSTATNIELLRRRSGTDYPAWVQGVGFNAVNTQTCVNGAPAALQCTRPPAGAAANVLGTGFTLGNGETLVYTFQTIVNAPLAGGVTQITNTAAFSSTQTVVPLTATVNDAVVRPGVKVEPNNAGFAAVPATPAGTTILFSQGVKNTGTTSDSFTVTLRSELEILNPANADWKLELIDPATGNVIATDTDGNGIWDGAVSISTGPLAVGETKQYTIRATVPFGTVAGAQNTVELTATSALSALVKDVGTDEITVLPSTTFGPVVLLPDHSGIVTAGESIAYTHRLFNNTGATETFDLIVNTVLGWPTTLYADTNGDGVYSPGTDLALPDSPTTGFKSSASIPNGGSQTFFVVTTAPNATPAGVDDVALVTARSRTNPVQVDSVTDTTTILAATTHDLAGGGTRMASVGDTTTYPGTLYNLTSTIDRYDFSLSASSLFGVDGLNHPTTLRVDTNADGVPDTTIAIDSNGDGVWDQTCGAGLGCSAATFKNSGNAALPDIQVPANGSIAYELVRAIDPAQFIWSEYATITATSVSTSEKDSVTAQWIISALSRASIRGLRIDPSGVVEFVTGTQQNTAFFNLYETAERSRDGARTLLNSAPVVSPVPDSLLPILYRVDTSRVRGPYLLIEETETTGNVLIYGPYSTVNTRLRRGLERVEAQMDRFGVPQGPIRVSRQSMARVPGALERNTRPRFVNRARRNSSPNGIRIAVVGDGEVAVPLSALENAGFPSNTPAVKKLALTGYGVSTPVRLATVEGVSSLVFTARAMSTDYTDEAAYILTWPAAGTAPAPVVSLTRSGDPLRPGYARIERNSIYGSVAPGSDPWQWDLLTGDGTTWPYPQWDPALGRFDLPNLSAAPTGAAQVRIRFVGASDDRHAIDARINGYPVGSFTFAGKTGGLLQGSVPASVLQPSGNELTLVYSAQHQDGTSAPSGYVYLDYLDVAAPSRAAAGTAVLADVRAYEPDLPSLSGVKYLIVTHPLFKAQADRLAELKTDERLKAAVVVVDTAYDAFSGGVQEPQAIAALIRKAAQTSRTLQYVVLFGDDALDPRNYLGGATPSYVPSIMGWDGTSLVPNENAYADLDGDGAPELAIGRLPVTTIEEATAVVDKIEAQTATLAASHNVHVFVSDDSRESDARFEESAREMSALLPVSSTSVMAEMSAGVGLARAALFGSWLNGVTMTHYFGHGGPEIWTDEALFSVDDVPDLGSMPPMVLLAWACQSQYYQNYYGPSVNEALFLAPSSGALASFGPVGISSPERQRDVYERVYRDLYKNGLSLGEIIRRAKREALAESYLNQGIVDGFMFFGDPSLKIPRP